MASAMCSLLQVKNNKKLTKRKISKAHISVSPRPRTEQDESLGGFAPEPAASPPACSQAAPTCRSSGGNRGLCGEEGVQVSGEGTVEAGPISLLAELRIQGFPGSPGLRLGGTGTTHSTEPGVLTQIPHLTHRVTWVTSVPTQDTPLP